MKIELFASLEFTETFLRVKIFQGTLISFSTSIHEFLFPSSFRENTEAYSNICDRQISPVVQNIIQ